MKAGKMIWKAIVKPNWMRESVSASTSMGLTSLWHAGLGTLWNR